MFIHTLELKQFRLFESAQFTFRPGCNLLCGDNAKGKTSILEALYFLATGRSFRTSHNSELMRHSASSLIVEAQFVKDDVEQKIKICWGKHERKVWVNSTPHSSLSSVLGLIPTVVSNPDDLQLIKGGPALRRQFLDLYLAQGDIQYPYWAGRYQRALKHRNALLAQRDTATLSAWEQEMAIAAAYIVTQRRLAVDKINRQLSQCGPLPLQLLYQSSVAASEEAFIAAWERLRLREITVGHTLAGPHRDDIDFLLGGHLLRSFGSEGQQRASLAALRLAQWNCLHADLHITPLLLIDDFALSLDHNWTLWLMKQLVGRGQIVISSSTVRNWTASPCPITTTEI